MLHDGPLYIIDGQFELELSDGLDIQNDSEIGVIRRPGLF